MDPDHGPPSMSLMVEMEEENHVEHRSLPHTNPVRAVERNKLPSKTNREPPSAMRLKAFVAPPPRQLNPENSSDDRKLDAVERTQLRAQLKGTTAVDTGRRPPIPMSISAPENLRNQHPSPSESLEAAENGQSFFAREESGGFAGEGVRPDVTRTTNTNSDTEIVRDGNKLRTMTNTSRSSHDSKNREQKIDDQLIYATDQTSTDCDESEEIVTAWANFEKSWKAQLAITEEEVRNGYRFFSKVDTSYLGFYPRKKDKRKFLKAYPIIGPIPEARHVFNCSLPMTFRQWCFVIFFFVFFIGLGVGGYFYLTREPMLK